MRFLCNHNQRLPNTIFDFRKIPNKKLAPSDSLIYGDEWKTYDGLMNVDYKKHYISCESNFVLFIISDNQILENTIFDFHNNPIITLL